MSPHVIVTAGPTREAIDPVRYLSNESSGRMGFAIAEAAVKAMIPMLKNAVPLKRMGTESEVSSAICFLLSEAAAFVTGATLKIDGAASLAPHMWPMPDHDRAPAYDGFHRAAPPVVLEEG